MEAMLINPRRRRRRTRKAKTARRRPARRRRTRVRVAVNPRRRRVYARSGRRGRRRRNPRGLGGFRLPGMNLPAVLGGAAGFVVTNWGAGQLSRMLPAAWGLDANIARIGSKAAVGIGLPMLLRGFLPRGVGNAMAIGGGIAVAVDLFTTFVGPAIGLSAYDTGELSAYEQGSLMGDGGSAYSGGAYE